MLPYRPAVVISLSGRNDAFYQGLMRRELGALDPYYNSLETPRWRLHAMNWFGALLTNRRFNWLKDFESSNLSFHSEAIEIFLRNQRAVHSLLQGLGVQHFLFLQPPLNYPERALAPEERGMDHDEYVAPLQQAYKRLE